MKKVKNILIFGAGSVGTHHANAARTLNCNVLICDINFSKFKYMKNNLYPKRYGNWDNKIKFVSYQDVLETNNIFKKKYLGTKCFPFIIPKSIDIDDQFDLNYARYVAKHFYKYNKKTKRKNLI